MLLGRPRRERTRSYATLASPLMLSGQSYHRPGGMAITPRQSALDVVASSLKGRPHGTAPRQVLVNHRASHGWGMAPVAVKTSHKVLPLLGQSHSFQDFSTKRALFFGSAYTRVPCPFARCLLRLNRLAPNVFFHASISSAISLSRLLSSSTL